MNIKKTESYKGAIIFFDTTTRSFIVRLAGRVSRRLWSIEKARSWVCQVVNFSNAKKPTAARDVFSCCEMARKSFSRALVRARA